MSKISVFGSSGFIGNTFCCLFPESTLKVEREENSSPSDKVVYFISTVSNYNVLDRPKIDIETNLCKLIDVLEANKDNPNFEFNFISSWFVYGEHKSLPVCEEDPCNPTGFYSITKRTAEQMLISYCKTFGIKYRIIRLCNVLGRDDRKASKKKNAVQFMIDKLKRDEEVDIYEAGSHVREFMHVNDVCSAISDIVYKGELNEIYNVSLCSPVTISSVIEYAKVKLNSKSVINSIETPEFHKIVQTRNIALSNKKLLSLGFTPKYNIWQTIDDIL